MALSDEVSKYMGAIVASDPKLLSECESICQIYSISPEDLKYKWEALTFSSITSRSEKLPPFTMESIAALKAVLQRDLQKNSAVKKGPRKMPFATAINRTRIPQNFGRNSLGGAVQVKVEPGSEASVAGPSKVSFSGPKNDASSRKKRAYRYMYEKIFTRSEVLDDRIDEFSQIVTDHYKVTEFGDPSTSTEGETVIIGRITQDTEFPSAKLADDTVVIESSRMHSSGARVLLRFDPSLTIRGGIQGAGALGVFPGAIATLKGKNGGANSFLVSEILALPPLKPSWTNSNVKPEPGSAFSLCVACGPFTPEAPVADANLAFKPLQTLLQSLQATKPTVVLLVGPFVDASHPLIKVGDVDSTPLRLFQKRVTEPLRAFLDSSPGSIAILVPSIRDVVSFHNVYPQCEFGPEVTLGDPRIHRVPNPARFSINDVKFAVTSIDVVSHLLKDELLKTGQEVEPVSASSADDNGTDKIGNLCRHLLQQRSFYPIFPVPFEVAHEVNLDVTHSEGLKLDDEGCAPDVLVVPSRLKHFAKHVHSTTVLNSSFLTKGTYSMLSIDPTRQALYERVKNEFVKLESTKLES
ncbi:DNA polymerase alpha/epsilon subunit B-domain-containing protein [Mycena floridula]|nr:DNA polymerase alpha/epsilon subunit B-domain-containing protein [Mycena floridula]